MSDNTKKNKDKKDNGEKKGPGRPKKIVTKSPKKAENVDDSASRYCACNDYLEEELSIQCSSCEMFWHLSCVGLSGMCEESVLKLTNWRCYDCFKPVHSYLGSASSVTISSIQPIIKATVMDALKEVIPQSVCSKEDVQKAVKSYADMTRETQKQVIEKATLAQSSKNVAESVVRKIDADRIEREKRKCNVVIMKVPEPNKNASKEEKKKKDLDFCIQELQMKSTDIDSCWRAGTIDGSKEGYCRPLIVKMKKEEVAEDWTRSGKGLRTENGFWVNRDLCSSDRKANFLAREVRRERAVKKE